MRHISNPVFKCPACGHIGRGADPHVSVRATIVALVRFGITAKESARAVEKAGPPTETLWALTCTDTPRRQNARDPQGARMPMNGKPRTDLIQLITRTESLSGDAPRTIWPGRQDS
jgi:hypothetical protein